MHRALVVQHISHEGLAGFADPLARTSYAIDSIVADMPGFDEVDFLSPDLLVLMGGPMAVYERADHPWIRNELERLAERLEHRRPTLGICLGAQMIATALGAQVSRGPAREVGFATIALTDAGRDHPLARLKDVPLLHWHGDGFEVPVGATLLARTALYPQAFAVGENILAIQCHPEMGAPDDGLGLWLDGSDAYLASAGTDRHSIGDDHRRLGKAACAAGAAMLDQWLENLTHDANAPPPQGGAAHR